MTLVCVAPDGSLEVWTLNTAYSYWEINPYGMNWKPIPLPPINPAFWGREVLGEL